MNVMALDLEMAQPSGKIVQVGACIFDIKNGKVIDTFSRIVKIDEPITEYITNLTGITQEMIDGGIDLFTAYKDLVAFRQKYKARKQVITWGMGDTQALKQQVKQLINTENEDWWDFGFRFYDAKMIYQAIQLSKFEKTKAGLGAALENLGLSFEGRQHDASYDAINTAKIFHHLLGKLRTIKS